MLEIFSTIRKDDFLEKAEGKIITLTTDYKFWSLMEKEDNGNIVTYLLPANEIETDWALNHNEKLIFNDEFAEFEHLDENQV